jgi:hypothetical protein
MSSLTKEDEEEVRIAVENNEYVALSYVKQLLDEIDSLRSELSFLKKEYGEADSSELTMDALLLKLSVLEQENKNLKNKLSQYNRYSDDKQNVFVEKKTRGLIDLSKNPTININEDSIVSRREAFIEYMSRGNMEHTDKSKGKL